MGTICGAAFSHYVFFSAMLAFFGTLSTPRMKFMPRVEDTFDPVVFFLAKMRVVTARFLWRNIKYAILIIFIVAAVLTPSTDPWNQTVFAAPMIGLYLISIGIAWIVGPRDGRDAANQSDGKLRLVFAATVIDQARRHHRRSPDAPRRAWPRR